MSTMTLKQVSIGDYFIDVSEDNELDFQNSVDTFIILLRMMQMNVVVEQINDGKDSKIISIKSVGEQNTSLKCGLRFYSSPDFLKLDIVMSVPYFDLESIREELRQEGYGEFVSKRLGGINIKADKRSLEIEQGMISLLKKLHKKT